MIAAETMQRRRDIAANLLSHNLTFALRYSKNKRVGIGNTDSLLRFVQAYISGKRYRPNMFTIDR